MSRSRRSKVSAAGKTPLVGVLLCFCLWAACGEPSPSGLEHNGPVILLTFEDLRADRVGAVGGEEGWTPELDRFAEEADWVGRAVTTSSSPIPSMLSLVTGVDPWQHGVLSHLFHQRRRDLPTLAETLTEIGYSSRLFVPAGGMGRFGGYDGYDSVEELGNGTAAIDALRSLTGGPEHIWVHTPFVGLPYRDFSGQAPALGKLSPPEKSVVRRVDLLKYADPERPMPAKLERAAQTLYRHGVAWGDSQVGRLLTAIRESGRMDDAMIVITALHGTELGEHGQTLFAQNLSRESIEVPLIVRWPKGKEPAAPAGSPVEQARVWATIAEAVGAEILPVHLPSLGLRSDAPILSSLFLHDAKNRFAVISKQSGQTTQLTVEVSFAAEEPDFFAAQVAEAQGRRGGRAMAGRLRRRLAAQFKRSAPFSGVSATLPSGKHVERSVKLERWTGETGTKTREDLALEERMVEQLVDRWSRFIDLEKTPLEESKRWVDG